MAIKDVAVSSGSACTSASLEPSYVLRALQVGDELAHSSIRFGLGRFNTEEEVDFVADLVVDKVKRLREAVSPLRDAQRGDRSKERAVGGPLSLRVRNRKPLQEERKSWPCSTKVIEHYEETRETSARSTRAAERRHRHGRRSGMRRRDASANQGQRRWHHRRCQVQDVPGAARRSRARRSRPNGSGNRGN